MNPINEKITDFIDEHHLLSLCVIHNNMPYCASCFYAFDKENLSLIIASNPKTIHIKSLNQSNNIIAGTIALDTKIVSKIKGIQLKGEVSKATKSQHILYLNRFKYATLLMPTLWQIRIDWIKFTDNKLGFGKKIIYNRKD